MSELECHNQLDRLLVKWRFGMKDFLTGGVNALGCNQLYQQCGIPLEPY